MTKRNDNEDHTAEVTIYVTPSMKDEIVKLAKTRGVTVSVLGRQAFASLLKDHKR